MDELVEQPEHHDLPTAILMRALLEEEPAALEFVMEMQRDALATTGLAGAGDLVAEEAWSALERLAAEIEKRATLLSQAFSSAEWLWYLRRARWAFDGINKTATTAPYVAALAEALSCRSRRSPKPSLSPGVAAFATDRAEARSVAQLRMASLVLYDVHSLLRWAGKGATIHFPAEGMPDHRTSRDLRQAVKLFDIRSANQSSFLSRAGLYAKATTLNGSEAEFWRSLILMPRMPNGHYAVGRVDLGTVPLLADATLPEALRWPVSLLDLLVLLWSTILSEWVIEASRVMVPWELVGYRVVAENILVVELDRAIAFLSENRLGGLLPPTIDLGSGQRVLRRLKTARVSTWPPTAGPPVRAGYRPWLFVDLFAATHRLQPALERPDVTGSLINAWATHFELAVQASIDDTAWRPSAPLAALRGRHLRRGGATITDIDALGERDGVLLAVSCKALAYSDEWDRGQYKTVRNVASSVADSVHDWRTKIAALRVSPGDNFDFTRYSQIVGVVVYPHVPWSPGGLPLHEMKPGLRAASTAEELSRWCRGEARPRKR